MALKCIHFSVFFCVCKGPCLPLLLDSDLQPLTDTSRRVGCKDLFLPSSPSLPNDISGRRRKPPLTFKDRTLFSKKYPLTSSSLNNRCYWDWKKKEKKRTLFLWLSALSLIYCSDRMEREVNHVAISKESLSAFSLLHIQHPEITFSKLPFCSWRARAEE